MKIDYTRYYLKWHQNTPEHRQRMVEMYRRLLSPFVPEHRDARILDVGCGMGFALSTLQSLGFSKVQGFDCDEGQIRACEQAGLNTCVVPNHETIQHLQSLTGQFDCILSLDVLEHIPRDIVLNVVSAVSAALKPTGRFVCSVPNANSAIGERWRYNDWTHHNSFSEHSLDFLLFNGGFNKIEIHPEEFLERPKRAWLPLGGVRHWWLFKCLRAWRRLEMMAELGPAQGRSVPLSLNLIAMAEHPVARTGK